jgi:hypothetical protein
VRTIATVTFKFPALHRSIALSQIAGNEWDADKMLSVNHPVNVFARTVDQPPRLELNHKQADVGAEMHHPHKRSANAAAPLEP